MTVEVDYTDHTTTRPPEWSKFGVGKEFYQFLKAQGLVIPGVTPSNAINFATAKDHVRRTEHTHKQLEEQLLQRRAQRQRELVH